MLLKVAKVTWIGLAGSVLLVTMFLFDGNPRSDIAVFLAWSMMVLSFPASLIFALLHASTLRVLQEFFSISVQVSYTSLSLYWLGQLALGYLQWFGVVPMLVKNCRVSATE